MCSKPNYFIESNTSWIRSAHIFFLLSFSDNDPVDNRTNTLFSKMCSHFNFLTHITMFRINCLFVSISHRRRHSDTTTTKKEKKKKWSKTKTYFVFHSCSSIDFHFVCIKSTNDNIIFYFVLWIWNWLKLICVFWVFSFIFISFFFFGNDDINIVDTLPQMNWEIFSFEKKNPSQQLVDR